jgi:hypothetical protein
VTGLASAGGTATGRAGGAAAAAGVDCLRSRFSTSPGLEICERSILVLISSASVRLEREDLFEACASLVLRKWTRTFSASWSSRELEWVFFSVTPASTSTSRMALLLTSSSRARSLIRILLIRLFFPPDYPAKSSYQPHGVGLSAPRTRSQRAIPQLILCPLPRKAQAPPRILAGVRAQLLQTRQSRRQELRLPTPPHWSSPRRLLGTILRSPALRL